jgi:hypothetical protein
MKRTLKQTSPWESKSLLSMIKEASAILARLRDAEIYHEDGAICIGCVAGNLKSRWLPGDRRPKTDAQWMALAAITVGFFKWENDSDAAGSVIQLPLN